MRDRPLLLAVLAVVVLAAAVAVGVTIGRGGRSTVADAGTGDNGPDAQRSRDHDDRAATSASPETPEEPQEPVIAAGARPASHEAGRDDACATNAREVVRLRADVERLDRQVRDAHDNETEERGTPIAPPASVPERLREETLHGAVSTAILQAHAPGSTLSGLDCSEYPCIAFGRLAGSEDIMERVERSHALVPYRDDVQTVLFWMATDESAPRDREERAEVGLFALAFYTVEDRVRDGDAIDKRIRSRTADLWNAIRPDEQPAPPSGI